MLNIRVSLIACEMLQYLLLGSIRQAEIDLWTMTPIASKSWQEPTFLVKAFTWSKWLSLRTWHMLEGRERCYHTSRFARCSTSEKLCTCRKSHHWHHRQDLYSNTDFRNRFKGKASQSCVCVGKLFCLPNHSNVCIASKCLWIWPTANQPSFAKRNIPKLDYHWRIWKSEVHPDTSASVCNNYVSRLGNGHIGWVSTVLLYSRLLSFQRRSVSQGDC